jgi:hypothetical protein
MSSETPDMWASRAGPDPPARWGYAQAALVKALPSTPFIAAIFTVAAATAPAASLAHWGAGNESHPVAPALFNLLVTWLLAATALILFGHLTAERVNPNSFHGLHTRLIDLETAHRRLCQSWTDCTSQLICCAVGGYLTSTKQDLRQKDARWVLGSGYASAWEKLHRAEETLITVSPNRDVWAGARIDQLRIKGSGMENEPELCRDLEQVICTLIGDGRQPTQPDDALLAGDTSHDGAKGSPAGHGEQLAEDYAKTLASHVRQTINEYRDRQWAQLIRTRGEISAATTFTAFTVYILLWTAIFWGATQDTILTGMTYFLIGAIVGLFNYVHIESESSPGKSIDDYGSSHARLFVTVLLSGLAALGGVVVISIFTLTQTGKVGAQETVTSLVDFLSIRDHPLNVIVALTFGLTPRILISRLKEQADEYKSAIRTSKAAHSDAAAPSTGI